MWLPPRSRCRIDSILKIIFMHSIASGSGYRLYSSLATTLSAGYRLYPWQRSFVVPLSSSMIYTQPTPNRIQYCTIKILVIFMLHNENIRQHKSIYTISNFQFYIFCKFIFTTTKIKNCER